MLRLTVRLTASLSLFVGLVAMLVATPRNETAVTQVHAGWEEMGPGSASGGGISNGAGESSNPSLAIGPGGAPIVAWSDASSGNDEIYVRGWSGSTWVEVGRGSASLGGITDNDSNSISPSLAIGPDGAPIVAWQDFVRFEETSYSVIYVRRWNGVAWVEMDNSASGLGISGGDSANPSLAIGPDGAPIVAWHNTAPDDDSRVVKERIFGEIYVRRWNGSAWVEMGSGSASGGGISDKDSSWNPAMAIGPDGMPILAWAVDENNLVYVKRWNGSFWTEMGGSASGDGIGSGHAAYPSIAIAPDGMPIVAWSSSSIQVRRWDGSTWLELPVPDTTDSQNISVAVTAGGAPIIAWQSNDSGNSEIYVRRWNGSAWVEVDSGSASGGGISQSNASAEGPSLTVGHDGTATIAWKDSSNNGEIYVRRYQPCHTSTRYQTGQPYLYNSNLNASYRLFLPSVVQTVNSFAETEPNNDATQADGPLCSGRAYVGLPNDHYDVFSLDADAGYIALELADHVGAGVQLQLHHQTLTTHPIGLDVNGADGYRVEVPNAPAGRFYVVISTLTPDPGATTHYTLTSTFTMSE